jgi:tyrosinase
VVSVHLAAASQVYTFPQVLPWLRYYLRQYETALQAIDPGVTVPYWDFTLDSRAPAESVVWTADHLGGNGASPDHAVASGAFQDWRPALPAPHPLARDWNGGDGLLPYPTREVIASLLANSTTYSELRSGLERVLAGVLASVGGDLSTLAAPNDPVFWLVVGNIDRLWDQWQQTRGGYEGTNPDGTPASTSDALVGLGGTTVADAISAAALC